MSKNRVVRNWTLFSPRIRHWYPPSPNSQSTGFFSECQGEGFCGLLPQVQRFTQRMITLSCSHHQMDNEPAACFIIFHLWTCSRSPMVICAILDIHWHPLLVGFVWFKIIYNPCLASISAIVSAPDRRLGYAPSFLKCLAGASRISRLCRAPGQLSIAEHSWAAQAATHTIWIYQRVMKDIDPLVHHRIPVVPHKAVAEVSKIGNL